MHINSYHIKTDDSEIFNPIRINWSYASTKGTGNTKYRLTAKT